MIFFILFMFVASTTVGCLKFLFLLVDFFVRMWRLKALFLTNLPFPVFLKRLAADLFVFILGIMMYLLSFIAAVLPTL